MAFCSQENNFNLPPALTAKQSVAPITISIYKYVSKMCEATDQNSLIHVFFCYLKNIVKLQHFATKLLPA